MCVLMVVYTDYYSTMMPSILWCRWSYVDMNIVYILAHDEDDTALYKQHHTCTNCTQKWAERRYYAAQCFCDCLVMYRIMLVYILHATLAVCMIIVTSVYCYNCIQSHNNNFDTVEWLSSCQASGRVSVQFMSMLCLASGHMELVQYLVTWLTQSCMQWQLSKQACA